MAGTRAIARLVTGIGASLGAALASSGSLFLAPVAAQPAPPPPASREVPATNAPAAAVQVSALELQQLVFTVTAIERLGLSPARAAEIRRLGPQLAQLAITNPDASQYLIPAPQAQSLRSLLDSFTPAENTALNVLLLSGLPPRDITLTRGDVETFLAIARQQPPTGLTPKFQKVLLSEAKDAGSAPESQLSVEKSQIALASIGTIYSLGEFPTATTVVPGDPIAIDELQEVITFTSRLERTSGPLQKPAVSGLVRDLSALSPDENGFFTLAPESAERLSLFTDALNGSRRRRLGRQLALDDGGSLLAPAVSVLTPIGFGGDFGSLAIGLSFQNETRFSDGDEDGALVAVASLGDPVDAVGLDITFSIFSLTSDNNSDAFENQGFGFQLSRNITENIAVGAGVENLITYPAGFNDSGTNTYVVASSFIGLREDSARRAFGRVFLSGGFGNGRFRAPEDFDPVADGGLGDFRPFGSVALQLVPRLNTIVEWTGQDISAGLSVVPFRRVPLVFTAAAIDLTGNAEEEFGFDGNPRFTAAVAYAIFF